MNPPQTSWVNSGLLHRIVGMAPCSEVELADELRIVGKATGPNTLAYHQIASIRVSPKLLGSSIEAVMKDGSIVALAAGVRRHTADRFVKAFEAASEHYCLANCRATLIGASDLLIASADVFVRLLASDQIMSDAEYAQWKSRWSAIPLSQLRLASELELPEDLQHACKLLSSQDLDQQLSEHNLRVLRVQRRKRLLDASDALKTSANALTALLASYEAISESHITSAKAGWSDIPLSLLKLAGELDLPDTLTSACLLLSAADLDEKIQDHNDWVLRRNHLLHASNALTACAAAFNDLISADHYVSESELTAWKTARPKIAVARMKEAKELKLPDELEQACLLLASGKHQKQIEARNRDFVDQQLAQYKAWFDRIESNPLTERQRLAAVVNEDRNLVVAGAGTGKTSVVVARVGYLLERGVKPESILILAFARKAKEELEERIAKRLRVEVEVRTFHSLGLNILGIATGAKPTLSKMAEDELHLRNRFGHYLEQLLRNSRTSARLTRFFAYHLRPEPDTEKIKTLDEYYAFLRAHGYRTLKGELCKSHQEIMIANWLALNGINYEYEAVYHAAPTASESRRAYQPDFYLPDHEVYLEHFGVGRRNRVAPFIKDKQGYLDSMTWKRALHKEHDTQLIETFSYMFDEGTAFEDLESALREHGVEPRPLTAEETQELFESSNETRPFIKLALSFLHLYKSQDESVSLNSLRGLAKGAADGKRLTAFLEVFEDLYGLYEADLKAERAIDFNDMIRLAIHEVREGRYRSGFDHIIVDEFQDIAQVRANLIQELLSQVEFSRLLTVGDDWQSIYRFTGSDVGLMTQFQDHFGTTRRTDLDRTFRFPDRLLNASSRFVTQNPEQIVKALTAHVRTSSPPIEIRFKSREALKGPAIQNLLQDIRRHAEGASSSVMILARYKHTLDEVRPVLRTVPQGLTIHARTVHAAKGLEADYVIVLDLNNGRYGFPSQIADDPLLRLVQPAGSTHPNAEERRLFYVALTRARKRVYLVGDPAQPSAFLHELAEEAYQNEVVSQASDYEPAICSECEGILIRRNGQNGIFWGCTNYPYCSAKGAGCPACDGVLDKKGSRFVCNRKACDYTAAGCPKCQKGALVKRKGKFGPFLGCSVYPTCEYTRKA